MGEKQTQQMEGRKKGRTPGEGPDADADKSPADEKKKLEADLNRSRDSSATKLAEEILGGKDAQGNEKANEKESKAAKKAAREQKERLSILEKSHPLIHWAMEMRRQCTEAEEETAASKEKCQKADKAAVHFMDMKGALITGNKNAPDTFEKWGNRVGDELVNIDKLVDHLPLPGEEKEEKKEEEPAVKEEETVKEPPLALQELDPAEDKDPMDGGEDDPVLLQESASGCDDLESCRTSVRKMKMVTSALTASSQDCEKSNTKLSNQISAHSQIQAQTQAQIAKTQATLTAMGGASHMNFGEAADAAADAAISASRLKLLAQKLAQQPHMHRETKAALKKASEAESARILARLRVAQAA